MLLNVLLLGCSAMISSLVFDLVEQLAPLFFELNDSKIKKEIDALLGERKVALVVMLADLSAKAHYFVYVVPKVRDLRRFVDCVDDALVAERLFARIRFKLCLVERTPVAHFYDLRFHFSNSLEYFIL